MVDFVLHTDMLVCIEQLLVRVSVVMRRYVEIAGYLVDIYRAHHLATFFRLETLNSLDEYNLLVDLLTLGRGERVVCFDHGAFRIEDSLLQGATYVRDMDPSHIDDVQAENAARGKWESHIKVQRKLKAH